MGIYNYLFGEKKEEKTKPNVYSMNIVCTNCKHNITIDIPKGVIAADIIKEKECDNCGLKNLKVMDMFDKFGCFDLATGKINK